MTYKLRWAAMRAILMFHNCEGQSHKTVSTDHNSWTERRAEADSNRGPSAYQPNALPLGQTGSWEDSQHIATFYCSLGVLAGVSVFWHRYKPWLHYIRNIKNILRRAVRCRWLPSYFHLSDSWIGRYSLCTNSTIGLHWQSLNVND